MCDVGPVGHRGAAAVYPELREGSLEEVVPACVWVMAQGAIGKGGGREGRQGWEQRTKV